MTKERDDLILAHSEAVTALEKAKETEMELRLKLFALAFPAATKGTNTLELGNGYALKGVKKFNYTLDKEPGKVEAVLAKLAKMGNEGAFLVDRLVSWKPSLSVSEYEDLGEKYRKVFDEVVTIKEATPTVELVKPKQKGK